MNSGDWAPELERITKEAADILLSYYDKKLVLTQKPEHGFVTEADVASEQFLIKALSDLCPEASFVAEESGKSGDSDYCWVIDPLDGTTNFAHHIPYFCISVALTYKNKPLVAAIYQPLEQEFFFAHHEGTSTLNGTPIVVSSIKQFNEGYIAIGLPYQHDYRARLMHRVETIARTAYSIRHLGAIALDLANVAAGRFDGVFFAGLSWWDVAAGILLIERAGGKISDFQGNTLGPQYRSCIAGGSLVYGHLKDLVAGIPTE